MLCTKIVFTSDTKNYENSFSEFLTAHKIKCKVYRHRDSSEVEVETDDEGLYDICCELSEYIGKLCIRDDIAKFLHSDYRGCFNSDEIKLICTNVSKRDFLKELPGRIYVYIRTQNTINPFAFYTFMCKDINSKVLDTVCDEADKLFAVNENTEFIELLKSFAVVSMESYDRVELTADSTGIRISSCVPKEEGVCTEYAVDEEDVLAELVTMNPKRIDIMGKEEFLNSEISTVITAVFEDRIHYN